MKQDNKTEYDPTVAFRLPKEVKDFYQELADKQCGGKTSAIYRKIVLKNYETRTKPTKTA